MSTQEAWGVLLNVPVGTIVTWFLIAVSVLTGIVTGTIKLYKVFSKVKDVQNENAGQKNMLIEHDKTLAKINTALEDIKGSLAEQKEVNLKQVRYQIVHTCDDALSDGFITAGKLKSLEEMYEEYIEVFHGNGYVKTLMKKVRQLEVRGKLDE